MAVEMRTRGASGWVGRTATGFPDWTISVSSGPRRSSAATMSRQRLRAPRRAAPAAVDDERVGVLGDRRGRGC